MRPRAKQFARPDNFGKPKFGGIDLLAYELTSVSALVFGQTSAGVPVAVVRGCDYKVSESENIVNTIWSQTGSAGLARAIRDSLQATACAYGLKHRLMLKIASWFI